MLLLSRDLLGITFIHPEICVRKAVEEQSARAEELGLIAPEMDGVGQNHAPQSAFAVHVKCRARKARVPIAALGKQRACQI